MIRWLLMYSPHIWGFVAAFWGAYGFWQNSGLAIAVALVAALLSASQFKQREEG